MTDNVHRLILPANVSQIVYKEISVHVWEDGITHRQRYRFVHTPTLKFEGEAATRQLAIDKAKRTIDRLLKGTHPDAKK